MRPMLVDLMRGHAARTPDKLCLVDGAARLSFGELDARSNRVARALIAQGVQPGDRVALLDTTSAVSYELFYGCAKAGAILMPLNWRLSPSEIAGIIADGRPALLLYAPSLQGLLAQTAHNCRRLVLGPDYAQWRDAAAATDPQRPVLPDEILLLLYTSGTTGQPKGVKISHDNLSFVERIAAEAWDFTADSVNLVAMPLFHIGGIGYGMMALSQGGATVLLSQPEPQAVLTAISQENVTHAFFVPTVVQRLIDHAKETNSGPLGLVRVIYGAAPMNPAMLRRAMAVFGGGFVHAYGMTETSGTVTCLPPHEHHLEGPHAGRLNSCGRALPWVEIQLVDPQTRQPVALGEVGEIWVRSGMVMAGYWEKPAETEAALVDGWLRTGDAAYQDTDGYIYIHDRYKDMIISGGENIYPTEIENVLYTHKAVAEVAVIGIPHPRWGETPRAYVVTRPGAAASAEELRAFVRDRLAHYKCPSSFVFLDALPRNASGKILKHELRALAERNNA